MHLLEKKYEVNVLQDIEGANGAGHQAITFENEDGTLRYISKDGTDENGGVYGKSKYTDKVFKNLKQVNDYYGKNVKIGGEYDIVATYKMTRRQILFGSSAASKYAAQYYNLLTNSCSTIVQKSIRVMTNINTRLIAPFNPIPNKSFINMIIAIPPNSIKYLK